MNTVDVEKLLAPNCLCSHPPESHDGEAGCCMEFREGRKCLCAVYTISPRTQNPNQNTKTMPKDTHEELKEKVIAAIDELNSDTSVSQRQTIDSLEEVIEAARQRIVAIQEDLQREEGE